MGNSRVHEVGKRTLVAASGEFSDFQAIQKMLDEEELQDWMEQDGVTFNPKEVASYLGRKLYARRSKMDPLWNQLVIGGVCPITKKKELHYVDHQGTAYEEDLLATGFGMHLALPILRKAYELNPEPTLEEAKAVLTE